MRGENNVGGLTFSWDLWRSGCRALSSSSPHPRRKLPRTPPLRKLRLPPSASTTPASIRPAPHKKESARAFQRCDRFTQAQQRTGHIFISLHFLVWIVSCFVFIALGTFAFRSRASIRFATICFRFCSFCPTGCLLETKTQNGHCGC